MSRATRNLVNASISITNMQENYLRDILQNILASNPSIVLKAMETKGFHFEKTEKKTITELLEKKDKTYKVVLTDYTGRMSLIKFVRETLGFGLGESKAWTENKSECPGGVFYSGLTHFDAKSRLREMNEHISRKGYNIQIAIMGDSESYTSIPPKEL